jgi:hypothetical protein
MSVIEAAAAAIDVRRVRHPARRSQVSSASCLVFAVPSFDDARARPN